MDKLISIEDRFFIAGHRGMAGSAISRALNRAGYAKQLLVDRATLDLEDSSAVRDWFKAERPDVVVLAAAKVGGILANKTYPADFLLSNLVIQNNVVRAAFEYGARRLLFLGSSCIYPRLCEQPIREESLLTGSLEPTNEWYAIAKIAGLKLCHALRIQHDFDAIALMPTNLYGPGDNYHATDSHVVAALIRRFDEAVSSGSKVVECWGSGSPLREFLHADDLGEASVFALENWSPKEGEPQFLNVGTGTDVSVKQLAEAVARATGFSGEIVWDPSKPDGTPKKQLDVSRLASLGWTARIPLEEGLASTVALFRDQLKQQLVRL